MSNVDTICTTDDPVDSLEWHEKLAKDRTFEVTVLPAWRPDKAMNLDPCEESTIGEAERFRIQCGCLHREGEAVHHH